MPDQTKGPDEKEKPSSPGQQRPEREQAPSPETTKPAISDKPVTAEEQLASGKAGDEARGRDPETVKPAPVAAKPVAEAAVKGVVGATPGTTQAGTTKAAVPTAPAKPSGPMTVAWTSEMVDRLKGRFGAGVKESSTYLGQNYLIAEREVVFEILQSLRNDEHFDYLVDVTAVHYPQRAQQFEVVWILYSFQKNERVRVKTQISETENAPSVTPLWSTANWLEREGYDMFGIQFEGHPDLRRILLPEGWKGHPLRKEYGIIQQDQEWVQINLGIESGQ